MFSQIARSRSNSTWDVGSRHLLSSWSQFLTLPFQSQVCLSTSKARPEGQLICFIPAFVHLRNRRATMAGYRPDTLSWASRTNEPDGDSHFTLLYSLLIFLIIIISIKKISQVKVVVIFECIFIWIYRSITSIYY